LVRLPGVPGKPYFYDETGLIASPRRAKTPPLEYHDARFHSAMQQKALIHEYSESHFWQP
jgi:hypothetical protein